MVSILIVVIVVLFFFLLLNWRQQEGFTSRRYRAKILAANRESLLQEKMRFADFRKIVGGDADNYLAARKAVRGCHSDHDCENKIFSVLD